jgi:hypothetical protein
MALDSSLAFRQRPRFGMLDRDPCPEENLPGRTAPRWAAKHTVERSFSFSVRVLSRSVELDLANTAEVKIDKTRQNESAKRERTPDGLWRASHTRGAAVALS